jgi:hypothetical protein
MTGALIAVGSALLGLVAGSSITFWATRREELAAALLATTVLAETLRTPVDAAALEAAWAKHQPALVIYLSPRHMQDLRSRPAEKLDELTELFWNEHQAFILTPLLKWLLQNTVSRRLERVLGQGDSAPQSPPA